jgi:hypothetical protein
MKSTNLIFATFFCTIILFVSSCSNDDKVNPDPEPDPISKIVTSEMNIENGGKTGTANASLVVSTSTGTAYIKLDVSHTDDLKKILIMKSENNGPMVPLTNLTNITSGDKTFTSGTANDPFSYSIPENTKSFILEFPVSVRASSSPVTDIYTIWITNGDGSFTQPTKNRILGAAVITLKYGANISTDTYSSASFNAGNQASQIPGFIVASGKMGVITEAQYAETPGSVDIRVVSLNSSGKKSNSGDVYLYSPTHISAANPSSDGTGSFSHAEGSNATVFMVYSTKTFENVNASDLKDLTFGTINNIRLGSFNTIAFKTSAGKIGVIIAKGIAIGSGGGLEPVISMKVLN